MNHDPKKKMYEREKVNFYKIKYNKKENVLGWKFVLKKWFFSVVIWISFIVEINYN